jgi:glycosyltransferase involved in cell wall biosynthesis
MNENIKYSVVIPVYNSSLTIEELCDRIIRVFEDNNLIYEIILVDDDSRDQSWEILKEIHRKNPQVTIIHLMKNYGQHNATLCGFKQSSGDYIITLDDDLQNPPEEIPKLLETAKLGYWVVFGKYPSKKTDAITKLLSYFLQQLIKKICGLPDSITTSSFSIYKRDVVNNILAVKTAYPFLPALIASSVSPKKIVNVNVQHYERKEGKSNYNLISHFKFSLNLVINYSSIPLMSMSMIGSVLSLFSFLTGLFIIINRAINPSYGLMGWNSIMVTICFIGGAVLIGLGVIGEYLRRILVEVSHGNQYIIGEIEI